MPAAMTLPDCAKVRTCSASRAQPAAMNAPGRLPFGGGSCAG